MRVALVHDWMVSRRGGERVLWAMHLAFPEAPIYTSVYRPDVLPEFAACDVRTSFLQRRPFSLIGHRFVPALRTLAFEGLDLSEFDVVISSSTAEAKGVITGPETLHVAYVHTPTRYYWSDYHGYLAQPGFGRLDPVVRRLMPALVSRRRIWDLAAAQRPDVMVANSQNVAARVRKYYGRETAAVIPPPVAVERFRPSTDHGNGLVVVGHLVPYKRVDLAVEACRRLGRPLTVVGVGPDLRRLQRLAGPETRFAGMLSDEDVAAAIEAAAALLFPGEEDFGIVPLEAMAAGRPVIAFGRGGALETVVDGKTGVLFHRQDVDSLVDAIGRFDAQQFDPDELHAHAESFSTEIFVTRLRNFVESQRG